MIFLERVDLRFLFGPLVATFKKKIIKIVRNDFKKIKLLLLGVWQLLSPNS